MTILPTVLSVAISLVSFGVGGSTNVAGRTISAETTGLFSGVAFADHKASSTVKCGKHKLEVTADELQIAGGKTIAIPPTCKAVKLVNKQGKLKIYFDGAAAN
jgi:hypothetical protein